MKVHDIASCSYVSSDAAIVLIMLWHVTVENLRVGLGAIASFILIDTLGNTEEWIC